MEMLVFATKEMDGSEADVEDNGEGERGNRVSVIKGESRWVGLGLILGRDDLSAGAGIGADTVVDGSKKGI